jgi:hypothetical protein
MCAARVLAAAAADELGRKEKKDGGKEGQPPECVTSK